MWIVRRVRQSRLSYGLEADGAGALSSLLEATTCGESQAIGEPRHLVGKAELGGASSHVGDGYSRFAREESAGKGYGAAAIVGGVAGVVGS